MKKVFLSAIAASALLLSGCNSGLQQAGSQLLNGAFGPGVGTIVGNSNTSSNSNTGNTVTALLCGRLDGVLGGSTLTADNIVGTWTYSGSSVVFESNNALQNIGGSVASSAIEQKVDAQFQKLGFNSNTCQFTFNSDKTFSGKLAGKAISGNYDLNTTKKTLKLTYLGGLSHTTVHAALNGGKLSLLFEADKLKTILSTLGGLSGNSTISTLSSLLNSYDGMLVGIELKK